MSSPESPNEILTADGPTIKDVSDVAIMRPSLHFESITFSGGDTLLLHQDDIVLFVGPNNAGKSAALRELERWLGRSEPQVVIKDAKVLQNGNSTDLRNFLDRHAQKSGSFSDTWYGGMGFKLHETHLQYLDTPSHRHHVSAFFSIRLATESRITDSNPAGAVALYTDPPKHPIHLLLMDPTIAEEISKHFRDAFGQDLIVFRAGGSAFPLLVGTKPNVAEKKDELSKEYVTALNESAIPLESQGDGMRSFATVLLFALASDRHSIQFLDEPEAFLHPPQAKLLGELIAKNRKSKSQLFISTHSADVVEGLISGGANNLRIVRIQREGNVNRARELGKDQISQIVGDTLTRYSGVFGGIFYQNVVIAESDADCLFYQSILSSEAVSGSRKPDVLFIHISGKHRMAQLAATLKALDVPVNVIADIDVFNEEGPLKTLVNTLGGNWLEIHPAWKALVSAVTTEKPALNAEQVKGMISDELGKVGGTAPFPKNVEQNIKRIFKTVSPWASVKRGGRSALNATGVKHFDSLEKELSKIGLWVVPEGELEGWCRGVDAGHGPAFVEAVLEKRNLNSDPELRGAREFMTRILKSMRH